MRTSLTLILYNALYAPEIWWNILCVFGLTDFGFNFVFMTIVQEIYLDKVCMDMHTILDGLDTADIEDSY